MTDASPASLTEQEARERAALIEIERYDITVDVRELQDGQRWLATSSITFRCRTPGATTFVDIVGEVVSARLNDVELDVSTHAAGRLPLPSLAAENMLVVSSVQSETGSGNAILRREHAFPVVDGEDHDGAGVLEHHPGERLLPGVVGVPDPVRPQRERERRPVEVLAALDRPALRDVLHLGGHPRGRYRSGS